MRQKAKLNWVQFGDDNTRFFHQSVKQRQRVNRILHLCIDGVEITDPTLIEQEFYRYYTNLFCTQLENRDRLKLTVARNGHVLTGSQQDYLKLCFSKEEIKAAMWSIPDDKAPGLDGFNSGFYKAAWEIVGDDVTQAISHFFQTGKMPRSWNTSTITLIPKTRCPSHPGEFRPIACCHVLYKCISKLICSRLQPILGSLIDQAQGAFVSGRSIMHYILLCQDLVK